MSAAVVSAVAGVASAGVAAYGASQTGSGGEEVYGSKFEPVPYDDNIGTEDSYAREIYGDTQAFVDQGLPQIFDIANRVQNRNQRRREKFTGRTFRDTVRQEGANILAMERGYVPGDVINSINRIVAEGLGGAVDPAGVDAGFGNSLTANNAARNLGLTSLDLMNKGMAFGPAWRQSADSFIYKPQDAARDFFFPAAQVALEASNIQLQRDTNQYISANNIARAAAMPNPAAVGSMNDSLQGNAMLADSIGSIGSALAGLVNFGGGGGTAASGLPPMAYTASGPGLYTEGGFNLNQPLV